MGASTFICKKTGSSWSGKKYSADDGYDEAVTAEADTEFELQKKLRELALAGESGGVSTSFNFITPSSAVFVVSVGGAVAVAAAGAPAAAGGGAAPAAEAKKEEPVKEEESEDEDMGFSLFD